MEIQPPVSLTEICKLHSEDDRNVDCREQHASTPMGIDSLMEVHQQALGNTPPLVNQHADVDRDIDTEDTKRNRGAVGRQ